MPKYSARQIERTWHLIKDHNLTIAQVSDILDCAYLDAKELVTLATKRFGRPIDLYLNDVKPVKVERPKSEYSNHSPMGLAS